MSPPASPVEREPSGGGDGGGVKSLLTSPTKLPDQKPFRGFDITSLIRKDDDPKPDRKSPALSAGSPSTSPNISVGPPNEPPTNPYSNLFNSGLYQQYLGQLLANSGSPLSFPGPGSPPSFPPLNPMLLQAQLAMAAQSNMNQQLLNNAYPASAPSLISERLKQHRFSPYSPPNTSLAATSLGSPTGVASAFRSLAAKGGQPSPSSPPVSPPRSDSPQEKTVSPHSDKSSASVGGGPLPSDIRNIENMINGLNGTNEGRFGLSHETRIS